jgi:hypothetical protein
MTPQRATQAAAVSLIENSLANPTFQTLEAVTASFGVRFVDLFVPARKNRGYPDFHCRHAQLSKRRPAAGRTGSGEAQEEEEEDEKAAETAQQVHSPATEEIQDHHLVVARLSSDEMKNPTLRISGTLIPSYSASSIVLERRLR